MTGRGSGNPFSRPGRCSGAAACRRFGLREKRQPGTCPKVPGTPGPPGGIGVVLAPARSSAPCVGRYREPSRCRAPVRGGGVLWPFSEPTFCLCVVLPLPTMRPHPSAAGSLSSTARFVPSWPAPLRPRRQEGRKHQAWSGRAASSAWCDQHTRNAVRAAPGRPRRVPPLRAAVAVGSGHPGCGTGGGLVPSRVRRRKEWEVGERSE